MTISTATSPDESLQTGEVCSPASAPAQVFYREFSVAPPLPLPNTVPLDALIGEMEGDPEMAAYLKAARQQLSSTLYEDEAESLSSLRLRAGVSQGQLARLVGTSQPHIARIEGGQTDPGTDLVARIATALGVDEPRTFAAIRYQRMSRGQES